MSPQEKYNCTPSGKYRTARGNFGTTWEVITAARLPESPPQAAIKAALERIRKRRRKTMYWAIAGAVLGAALMVLWLLAITSC